MSDVEKQTGTDESLSDFWETVARGGSQSGATAPASPLTRTVGDDGSIQWQVARQPRRRPVVAVAAVAAIAATLGVGYFAVAGGERTVSPTSRPSPAPSAIARPAAASPVVAPVQPIDAAHVAVAEPAPPVEAAITPAPAGTGSYTVQIAAVPTVREAEHLVSWLAKDGYSAYVEPTTTGRGPLLRVRVGPLPSLEAAQNVAAQLVEAGYAAPWVTEGDVHRKEIP